ncbi:MULTISPECIES: hypothetical protein [Nitrosopumilus]|uniref:Uncharacterized protein n=1 Tax=Nitrosopumilus piranensis TaxID=1582439 RepID=A0A0C5BXX2_9ARCH|nr:MULTISPECIES: hypothetical protein [Nitrosopumilus]AJM93166.1 hypothetical protein NPIRD3C_1956 [Nitrosopumilus piranensis]
MSKRISLIIDDHTYKKLRLKQASEMKKTTATVSFSKVINDILKKSI